jgi:hypothetical protein
MSEQTPKNTPPQENPAESPGLNLEEVRTRIMKEHGENIPKNDPLLMIVTICSAYLGEVQKLHTRHKEGLALLMAEKTDAYVAKVNSAVDQLSASLSSASVEGIRKIFDDHAATLNAFRHAVIWAAAIVSVSALVNVTVFVLRGL